MKLTNALSVDVEDYFQVGAFEHSIRSGDWDHLEHRIVGNMDKVLSSPRIWSRRQAIRKRQPARAR